MSRFDTDDLQRRRWLTRLEIVGPLHTIIMVVAHNDSPANAKNPVLSLPRAKGARYDARTRQNESGCLKDTRVDLLKQFDRWVTDNDKDAPWMFVLQGLAGTGKSTFAYTVCRLVEERGWLGASFFFSRNDASSGDPFLFFTTIAYQLAIKHPQFRHSLNETLKTDPDIAGLTLDRQLEKLVVEPIRAAADDMGPTPVVVIVDAVDECANYRAQILALLCSIRAQLPVAFKLFVSLRPEHDLQSLLSSSDANLGAQSFILHDVDASVVRGDIERFLRFRLSRVAASAEIEPSLWPSAEDISDLTEKSHKLFIFAATVVKFIEDAKGDPRSTLKAVMSTTEATTGTTRGDGRSPYEHLDQLYQQVIECAFPQTDTEDIFERFRTVMGAVTLLYDTLTVNALSGLLQMEAREIRMALLGLHSLVIVPDDDHDIRLIHPSFRDFMTQRCPPTNRYFISPADRHRQLALMCFKTMQANLKRDICDIRDMSLLNEEVEDLGVRIIAYIPARLRYACRHWATHLSECRTDPVSMDNEVSLALMYFTSLHLLHWLEVLSLIGCLAEALPALRHTQDWVSVSQIPIEWAILLTMG
jgi:hypothetical protein